MFFVLCRPTRLCPGRYSGDEVQGGGASAEHMTRRQRARVSFSFQLCGRIRTTGKQTLENKLPMYPDFQGTKTVVSILPKTVFTACALKDGGEKPLF